MVEPRHAPVAVSNLGTERQRGVRAVEVGDADEERTRPLSDLVDARVERAVAGFAQGERRARKRGELGKRAVDIDRRGVPVSSGEQRRGRLAVAGGDDEPVEAIEEEIADEADAQSDLLRWMAQPNAAPPPQQRPPRFQVSSSAVPVRTESRPRTGGSRPNTGGSRGALRR